MKRNWLYLPGAISLVLLMSYGLDFTGRRSAAEGANVVVILIDALRADHVGCYGYPRETTPNIDEFSGSAVTFTGAISPSSWTKPSIPSLFTSLYPSRHGVFEGSSKDTRGFITSDILRDSLVTMAEVFRENNYQTAAFVHNAQLKGFLGFSQGFDSYNDKAGDAEEIRESFAAWLGERGETPFFAYLHFLDVHWPYQPPEPYDTIFGTYQSTVDFNTDEWKALRGRINDDTVELSDADLEKMNALYDGELRYLDDQIGILLNMLRERGVYENTLIILTSDHGEEFLEHGKIGHGQSLYGELLSIPLIIKFPGQRWEGGEVGGSAELVDILPTLGDYLGWETPFETDGRSLLPAIDGEEENSTSYAYSELLHKGTYQRAMTGSSFKLIETYTGDLRRGKRQAPLSLIGVGDRVEIDGMPGENYTFVADKIALDDNQADGDDEVEGVITKISKDPFSFRLMDFEVIPERDDIVRTVDGEKGGLDDLREGMRVKANGNIRDGYIYEVDRLKIRKAGKNDYTLEGIVDRVEVNGDGSLHLWMMGYEIAANSGTEIEEPTIAVGGGPQVIETELYDLTSDPGERVNLAESSSRVVDEIRALIENGFPSIAGETIHRSSEVRELDAETIEELKAIGYIK